MDISNLIKGQRSEQQASAAAGSSSLPLDPNSARSIPSLTCISMGKSRAPHVVHLVPNGQQRRMRCDSAQAAAASSDQRGDEARRAQHKRPWPGARPPKPPRASSSTKPRGKTPRPGEQPSHAATPRRPRTRPSALPFRVSWRSQLRDRGLVARGRGGRYGLTGERVRRVAES